MENFFAMNLTEKEINAFSNLGLAHIGDGVFDGCENLVLWVAAESTAEEYVVRNDLLYELK